MKAFVIAAALALVALAPTAAAQAQPQAGAPLDWRVLDPENTWVIETSKGTVVVELLPDLAPAHVARIKELTRKGFYDGLVFHRVIGDFMAQTGDPKGDGSGGSELPDIAGEFTFRRTAGAPFKMVATARGISTGFVGPLPVITHSDDVLMLSATPSVEAWGAFCPGVVGMARQATPNSANSQFYLMRGTEHFLDKQYTAFGYIVAGLDVARSLQVGEPPANPDRMVRVRIAADMPEAERPRLEVMDTRGPSFHALVTAAMQRRGAEFDICDVQVPSRPRAG